MRPVILLLLLYQVLSYAIFPQVPQLYARSTNQTGRLRNMFVLTKLNSEQYYILYQLVVINPLVDRFVVYGPKDNVQQHEITDLCQHQYYILYQLVVINPLVDRFVVYGPKDNVQQHEITDLCQHAKPFLSKYYNTTWKNDNFCENVFCEQNSTQISYNTTLQRMSVISYCHFCEETIKEKTFINLIQNGSCKLSNQILSKYEKCGTFMKYKDEFPYPNDDFDLCYSIQNNRFYFRNNFENMVLAPFNYYGQIVYTSIVNLFIIVPSIFIIVIPEIVRVIKVIFVKKRYTNLFRFLFSIRHQIIVLSLLSLVPPFITLLVYVSQLQIFYDFSSMISFCLVAIAFFQVVVLWAHICIQSDTLEAKISKKLIITSIVSYIVPVFVTLISLIQLIVGITFSYVFPEQRSIILPALIASLIIYIAFLFVVMIFIIILLWVFSIRMFKTLSRASPADDAISRTLYFAKLKFTRLNLLSSVAFLASMVFLSIWLMNYSLAGVFSWYVYMILPVLWNLAPSMTAAVLLIVPQLYTRSTNDTSRLKHMFVLTQLKPKQYYILYQLVVINPLVDRFVVYGPKDNVQQHEITDLCQHAKPFLSKYYNTTWKNDNFCENVFCEQNSTQISYNTTLQRMSVISYCHFCEETIKEKTFINLIQNGSCKLSNQILSKYEKCGTFMKYKDEFPYPNDDFDLCYSIQNNRFYFRNNFENMVLAPFNYYGQFLYTSIFNFLIIIPITFITIVPEIVHIFKVVFSNKNYKSLIRFLFSIRHQIIVLSLLSFIPPFITLLIYLLQLDIFYDFSSMISFCLVAIAFFQVVVLWAHICVQAETLEANMSKKLLAISVLSFVAPISVTMIAIFQLLVGGIFANIFPEQSTLILSILVGCLSTYIVFLFVVMIIIVVSLWIFSIWMFRILCKASPSDDAVSKTLYFAKLKFTRLTLLSSFAFFASMIFLSIWILNSVLAGVFSWYVYTILPVFWNLAPSMTAGILLIGMTNEKSLKETYFCCFKKKKIVQ
eukprot:gene8223-48_t